MPSINHLDPYNALAEVYQAAGFADYSAALAPQLIELAFDLEWSGRSLYDMACGTGELMSWFAGHNFRVVGVDLSPQMLRFGQARANTSGMNVEYVHNDIRSYAPGVEFELVTCLGGSLNYMATLRDLEHVFAQAHAATAPGKLFIFDLYTIHELAGYDNTDTILFDNGGDILIMLRQSFNYETLLLTRRYIILNYSEQNGWQRSEEVHTLRGYPIQAVSAILSKQGFKVLRTLSTDLKPVDNTQHDLKQVIFVAGRDS
ncbi:MAG: class I SAM-dependent methyltransferase [Chloroflexota bacterium]